MGRKIKLYPHQQKAVDLLQNGSILCGGVGSGKSLTSVAYYYNKVCEGPLEQGVISKFGKMKKPIDLYIITTARKRDTFEWDAELLPFLLTSSADVPKYNNVKVTVDSWNNVAKYVDVKDAFFIFDEQRVVGYGKWARSFIKITKKNKWILLTATPGDTWTDYIPVFIANGFYKNKTAFTREHVVYNRYTKYPKIDRFLGVQRLERLRDSIIVHMKYEKQTVPHSKTILLSHDKDKEKQVLVNRWDIFKEKPIQNVAGVCYILRRVTNTDQRRIDELKKLIRKHPKTIIFYNFNYELELLREVAKDLGVKQTEWNGHKHEPIPKTKRWVYLVQYTAGAEGWNCIETDTIIFYSQNYSYKTMIQAAGRIDRMNTPFKDLYYYYLRSSAKIDIAIAKALKTKKNFNVRTFSSLAPKT